MIRVASGCQAVGTLWLAVIAPSCSFDRGSAVLADDGGVSDGGEAPVDAAAAPRFGFSLEYEHWSVPEKDGVGGFHSADFQAGSANNWRLIDLDGDNERELVQTSNPIGARSFFDETGEFWKVFLKESGGFSAIPVLLRLPNVQVNQNGFSATSGPGWDLVDLDGDGLRDLILLTDPATSELWIDGVDVAWQFLKGTGTSFEAAVPWRLPDLGPGPLKFTQRCDPMLGCWRLADLNSDGLPDLVHSSDAVTPVSAWDALTSPNWHVYLNDGSGFQTTSTVWTLPSPDHPSGFYAPDALGHWTTMDLDGDSVLEIVQTRGFPLKPGPFYDESQPVWRLYDLETSGISVTPRLWKLPVGSTPFENLSAATDSRQWGTIDIDGDGLLDLVHTANSEAATPSVWGSPNSDQWKVYLGTVDGFSPTVTPWPVPDSGLDDGFFGLSSALANRRWVTVDLDGDRQVELVQTADPATDAVWRDELDKPYWRVYRRATN